MRRLIHKFKTDTKGAVSLFFIMITAVVFAFNAVLIDYARILAAEQQTEYAVQSAVRSSLAAYDKKLREYGLFGVEAKPEEFSELIKENIEAPTEHDGFQFIDPKVEASNIVFSRELANPDIIEHQILEEMKYKAPVEIVKELIEKFTFVTKAMKETSAFIDTAEKIQDDFEKREKLLDETQELLDQAKTDLTKFDKSMTTKGNEAAYPTVKNFTDVVAQYPTYQETEVEVKLLEEANKLLEDSNTKLEEEKKQLEDELEELEKELDDFDEDDDSGKSKEDIEDEIEQLENDIKSVESQISSNNSALNVNEFAIDQLKQDSKDFMDAAKGKITEMTDLINGVLDKLEKSSKKIDEAKKLNDKIREAVEKAGENAEANYGDAESKADPAPTTINADDLTDAVSEIEKNSEQLKEYPYEDAFFTEVKNPLDEAIAALEDIPTILSGIDIDLTVQSVLQQKLNDIKSGLNEGKPKLDQAIKVITEDRKEFLEKDEEETEANEKQAEEMNDKAEEMLNDLATYAADQAVYEQLQTMVNKYNAFVEENEAELEKLDLSGDAGDSASGAMGLVDSLFSGIGKALTAARNDLYKNEYVLMHFESRPPTAEGFSSGSDFLFENREAEYILYGIHEAGANYGAALAQLFAIRFALRFIAAFTTKEVRLAGHPLAVFVAALAYAMKWSFEDVKNISRGVPTPLLNNEITKIEALPMKYKDYLRLFFFMNPSGDKRLIRIMSVIEKKTSVDLTERMTYVEGNVTTSSRLLFVPEIAQSLNVIGVLDGNVKDNRFEFTKEAHFSY